MTHIRHPESPKEIAERDRLLQAALRPFPTLFPIAQEYPTVLSSQDVRYSWGLYSDSQHLVAHANLWPRVLLDHKTGFSMNVGLIGNVATDPAVRGQGHMSLLLDKLAEKAKQDGLHALILWSDLSEFYQKRGFSSCGLERRYLFHTPTLQRRRSMSQARSPFTLVRGRRINIKALAPSRFPVQTTLTRDDTMWSTLMESAGLSIFAPATAGKSENHDSTPFVAIGKGHDLINVVHEWGAPTPEVLIQGLITAGEQLGYEELLLLCPFDLPESWDHAFRPLARDVEVHPMALARVLKDTKETRETLARTFIWGLDSI